MCLFIDILVVIVSISHIINLSVWMFIELTLFNYFSGYLYENVKLYCL